MTDNRTFETDSCQVVRLDGVEVQENGIIRDNRGWIIGRADTEWMRYTWRMLVSGVCPCCGRESGGEQMSDETILLPCPFCGGEAILHNDLRPPETYPCRVYCVNCHAGTDNYSTEAKAIAIWNTRAVLVDVERFCEVSGL